MFKESLKKTNYDVTYIVLGIMGAIIILYGHEQRLPQAYYIFGSFLLLATAIHFRLLYFIALEIILAAGHSAILLNVGRYIQVALPVFLCLQLLIFYLMVGRENSVFLIIGVVGIALHSVGFSYSNQWIFFTGSLFIATYSYHSGYKGRNPAYIWAVLNTIFTVSALYKIFI